MEETERPLRTALFFLLHFHRGDRLQDHAKELYASLTKAALDFVENPTLNAMFDETHSLHAPASAAMEAVTDAVKAFLKKLPSQARNLTAAVDGCEPRPLSPRETRSASIASCSSPLSSRRTDVIQNQVRSPSLSLSMFPALPVQVLEHLVQAEAHAAKGLLNPDENVCVFCKLVCCIIACASGYVNTTATSIVPMARKRKCFDYFRQLLSSSTVQMAMHDEMAPGKAVYLNHMKRRRLVLSVVKDIGKQLLLLPPLSVYRDYPLFRGVEIECYDPFLHSPKNSVVGLYRPYPNPVPQAKADAILRGLHPVVRRGCFFSLSGDGLLQCVEIRTGDVVGRIEAASLGFDDDISAVCVCDTGEDLLLGTRSGKVGRGSFTVRAWHESDDDKQNPCKDRSLSMKLVGDQQQLHSKGVVKIVTSGNIMVTTSEDHAATVSNVAAFFPPAELATGQGHLNGKSTGSTGSIQKLLGHDSVVTDAVVLRHDVWAQNGGIIVTSSMDKTVRSWGIGEDGLWQPLSTLRGHAAGVLCLAVCEATKVIISGSSDKTIRLWKSVDEDVDAYCSDDERLQRDIARVGFGVETRATEGNFDCIGVIDTTDLGAGSWVYQMVVDEVHQVVYAALRDKSVCSWDIHDPDSVVKLSRLESHRAPATAVALYGHDYLISGTSEGSVIVWRDLLAQKRPS